MACILLWSSPVRVHDSQAYRKMDVTRVRISHILELREILLSVLLLSMLSCPGEYLRLGTLITLKVTTKRKRLAGMQTMPTFHYGGAAAVV